MKSAITRNILFTVTAAVSLFLDQWTKVLSRTHLRPLRYGETITVVDGFFDLRYSENPGVAFGMLQQLPGGRILLSVMALAALGLVFHYLRRTDPSQTLLHLALGLVGGGAVGNLIDRIIAGKVSDFIVWHYHGHEWPAFNVADAALVVGVCLMALDMMLGKRRTAGAPPEPVGGSRH
jgi:signal peptidase II